ncbi:MAG: hypothetical protein HY683_05095 [Chloroflexi bacterium]|nr:hypothetical protein [Chloroflexota bacterium]
MLRHRHWVFPGVLLAALLLSVVLALPALAGKEPKSDVCHFQAEDEFAPGPDGVLGTEDDVLVSPLGWRVISISDNALPAHIGEHTDGAVSDFVISTEDDLARCQALEPFIEEAA